MAGIDDVLERLLTDAGFARQLAADPADALAGYELSGDDLDLLSAQVSFDRGSLSTVEERISKAGMFGLLSSFTAGLGGLGGPDTMPTGLGGPDTIPTGLGGPDTMPAGLGGPDTVPGGGGGGDEFAIKEVDPAPAPTLDNPGAISGFDPQPDPPGDPATGPSGIVDPGDRVGFDPQPDPPGDPATGPGGLVDPGDAVGFNPQPDPPGEPQGIIIDTSVGDPGGTHGIIIDTSIGDPNQTPGGGGGGGGDAVSIKEVDPAPAPTLDNPGVARGFNPQPDPPGSPAGGLHPGEEKGIIVYD
jgi:hypothetical protein